MIRVRQIKVPIYDDEVKNYAAKKLKITTEEIKSLKINKKSIDARNKNNIHYVYEVDVKVENENIILKKNNKDISITPLEKYVFKVSGTEVLKYKPIIIGSGPAGLFCAYLLAENGYKPIIIERGETIEKRIKSVSKFWEKGILNINSNVQFGEGGAGTFSDGKLNTLVKDKSFRMKKVFEIFVKNGAPEEIMYLNKPHIGTDNLRKVVVNIRNEIIKMGGEFRYNTCLTDLDIQNNQIKKIILNNKETINCNVLVLALGHSSRDTFEMLYKRNIEMIPKPFAVGIRIQNLQSRINHSQYGNNTLPPASYKLTYNTKEGRGVYTFCMCPGGYIVNSSSEKDHLVVNGMSNYKRDSQNANSAIIVTVSPDDYGNNIFDGIKFQRNLERKAYEIGKGKIPIQLYKDYKKGVLSKTFKSVQPEIKGEYNFADINEIFPEFINNALKEGIDNFDTKIKDFSKDAIIAGVESRTSSPIRIIRDENLNSNIKGIYPCGEGAGYSGGITTSAMDGIKVAEAIAIRYKSFN